MRILVAEDEEDLNQVINKKLRAEGYAADGCFNGEEVLEYTALVTYDVILLDVMMPKMDGLEALKQLRARGDQTPVIFLTARDAVSDRVRGLDLGGDDYLVKPFSFDELLARIRARCRKSDGNPTNVYRAADLVLDVETHEVRRGRRQISLSAREYALLEYLLRNKNKVLSRQKIEDNVWNFDYEGGTNVVDVYITYLRRKIDDGCEKKLIQTVRGYGYTLKE